MDNKILNDNELEKVSGGWNPGAPASVTTCPCCGVMDTTATLGTGHDPKTGLMTGLISCRNPNCNLRFEVYLEGELSGTHTGKYYAPDGRLVTVEGYRTELIEKGLL